jgi:hypothetical protein
MKRVYVPCIALGLLLTASATRADELKLKQCSTEKVNHEDCVVVIDRRYPVTLPTIQMSPGKKVHVWIQDPLSFETLSLDETSATALPGTDQGAALLTAAIPNMKNLAFSDITQPGAAYYAARAKALLPKPADPCQPGAGYNDEKCKVQRIEDIFVVMDGMLDNAQKAIPNDQSPLFQHVVIVYAQINQALAPIPKAGSREEKGFKPPAGAPWTPDPWTEYAKWRTCMLYELAAGTCTPGADASSPATCPPFGNLLAEITKLQNQLPTTPPAPPPDNPIFDQSTFSALVKQAKTQIDALTDAGDKSTENKNLGERQARQSEVNSILAVLSSTLTNVQKDFLTYYQNVLLKKDVLPGATKDKDGKAIPYSMKLGAIGDPRKFATNPHLVAYKDILGRQVVFAINAVNNIATPVDSVVASSAKTAIATVTVLYADPRFETSAGAVFSFVHNRTFTNQTITSTPPGSTAVPGSMLIFQNKTAPEVVPFVAGHYRIGHDFMLGQRRSAFYATAWLGLNPYTTLPEYGAGPTFSWRSFMISALYNRAHESVLTPGLTVGMTVCSPSSTVGMTPPPCNPAPAAPTTQTRAINAFAIGLSVRIPTSFAAGTGGVSR